MASNSQPLVFAQTANADAERLFQEWRNPLLRFLVCSGLSTEDSRDIVQDTFLRLHQHLIVGGPRDNLRAWLFQVARNGALNRHKSGAQRLSASLDSELDAAERAACPKDDPERLFLKKERLRLLHAAMKDLTTVERDCVFLRSEGLRYREIAAVIEIGTSTVADHLERALRKLREKCNV